MIHIQTNYINRLRHFPLFETYRSEYLLKQVDFVFQLFARSVPTFTEETNS